MTCALITALANRSRHTDWMAFNQSVNSQQIAFDHLANMMGYKLRKLPSRGDATRMPSTWKIGRLKRLGNSGLRDPAYKTGALYKPPARRYARVGMRPAMANVDRQHQARDRPNQFRFATLEGAIARIFQRSPMAAPVRTYRPLESSIRTILKGNDRKEANRKADHVRVMRQLRRSSPTELRCRLVSSGLSRFQQPPHVLNRRRRRKP